MSTCKRCGAEILWIRTPSGKVMPCNAQQVYIIQGEGTEKAVLKDGQVVSCQYTEDPDRATGMGYVPHFATCKPSKEDSQHQPESIYSQRNAYGYRLNLRHSLVQKLYFRYKDKLGISRSTPLSDGERMEFERQALPWLERREKA